LNQTKELVSRAGELQKYLQKLAKLACTFAAPLR